MSTFRLLTSRIVRSYITLYLQYEPNQTARDKMFKFSKLSSCISLVEIRKNGCYFGVCLKINIYEDPIIVKNKFQYLIQATVKDSRATNSSIVFLLRQRITIKLLTVSKIDSVKRFINRIILYIRESLKLVLIYNSRYRKPVLTQGYTNR